MTARAATLVARNAGALDASGDRRLMREIAAGSVEAPTFAAYLRIEEHFVWTAARVYGACLWEATDQSRIRMFADAAADLVGPQIRYFERVSSRWLPDARIETVLERAAVLEKYVLHLVGAEGTAAAMTALLAAETLYSGWCRAALDSPGVRRHKDLDDWLELHTTPGFLAHRDALGALVDDIPASVPDNVLDDWFTGTLRAEDIFHDAPYSGDAQ